jgi:hypothetical protein
LAEGPFSALEPSSERTASGAPQRLREKNVIAAPLDSGSDEALCEFSAMQHWQKSAINRQNTYPPARGNLPRFHEGYTMTSLQTNQRSKTASKAEI